MGVSTDGQLCWSKTIMLSFVIIFIMILVLSRATQVVIFTSPIISLSPLPSDQIETMQTVSYTIPLADRYGVGGSGNYADYLGIIWWREWDHFHRPTPPRPLNRFWTVGKLDNRVECMPGTWSATRANIDAIFACDQPIIEQIVAEGYTGQVWEIGNEPNWHPYVKPANYVYQFNLYWEFIKILDPTAKMMIGGISLYPGSWSNWLDSFLYSYRAEFGSEPPIDLWNCHPYDIFDSQAGSRTIAKIKMFRSWLDDIEAGEFWITEFGKGNWLEEPEDNIVHYLNQVCSWLNQNHEQYNIGRWFWWGILTGPNGMGSNGLFNAGPYGRKTVTKVGDAYITQFGRVFVDSLEYERDDDRIVGSMRNPLYEIPRCAMPEVTIYDFRDGSIVIVSPCKVFVPLIMK